MQACPACRRPWPDDREVCPRCLAALVDDVDGTVTCPQCGRACPTRMQTCPACFALLRAGDADLGPLLAHATANGNPLPRPPGRLPFAGGHASTVQRLGPRSRLVLAGPDGFIEATVTGRDDDAEPPLRCEADDRLLFVLTGYPARDAALVAIGADGASVATFLCEGLLRPEIVVRDETSAPVARVLADLRCMDTAGRALGRLDRVDVEREGWVDDQWTLCLSVAEADVPMQPLALVALPLVAKVLLGRRTPAPVRTEAEPAF